MAVGNVAGAQGVILGELETEFGGAARAAGSTFAGSLTIAQTALGNVKEAIAGPFIGVLGDLLKQAAPVISAFADRIPDALAAMGDALAPTVSFIKANLGPVLAGLVPVLAAVAAGFVALIAPAVTAAAATVLAFAPVVLAVGAIGLAVFALKKAWDLNLGDIQGKTAAVWGVMEPIFATIVETLQRFGAEILPEAILAWQNMSAMVQGVWTGLVEFFTPALEAFAGWWKTHWMTISAALAVAWDAITLVVRLAWDALSTLVLTGLDVLQGDWKGAWERITGLLDRSWDDINRVVRDAWAVLKFLLGEAWTHAQNLTRDAWNAVAADLSRIWGNITQGVQDAANGVISFLSQAWDVIRGTAVGAWEGIRDAIISVFRGIVDPIQAVIDGVLGKLRPVEEAIARVMSWKPPTITNPVSAGISAGQALGAALRPGGKPGETQAEVDAYNRNVARAGKGGGPEIIGGDAGKLGEGAISKALGLVGSQAWNWLCQKFVENMFGTGGRYASAKAAAGALMTNRGGTPGRGSLVFFAPDASNANFGHVGIALGGDKFVSATAGGVKVDSLGDSNWGRLFQGSGLPKFAQGVTNFGGGLALVGERGAEVVHLPKGSDVIPNHRLTNSPVGSGVTYNIKMDFSGATVLGGDTRKLAQQLVDDMRIELIKYGQRNGTIFGGA